LTVLRQIVEQAQAQSLPEVIAVVAAILYLAFAIREQIVCWFFAAVSTAIYVWLFVEARLYMESVLNVFYLVMAGYGWYVWRSGSDDSHKRPVVVWPLKTHLVAIVVVVLLSCASGYWLSEYSDAAFPYIDSLTTWFAIWATFLVARKVLENWWYWLLIDIASVFIYWSRDLQLTSMLFVIYVIMIPIGLISWTKSMHTQAMHTQKQTEFR
jgi:nicotinamide mononucleotide transporter